MRVTEVERCKKIIFKTKNMTLFSEIFYESKCKNE